MLVPKILKRSSANAAIITFLFVTPLLDSCKNKSMLRESYERNASSNVHWRYYVYKSESFFNSLRIFDKLQIDYDTGEILKIVNLLLTSLDKDIAAIKKDEEFFLFMRYSNNNDSTGRYVDLYYNLAKSRLSNVRDSIERNEQVKDLTHVKEYYIRFRASMFFPNAWFYVTQYHISDVFFRLFIDEEVFENLNYPNQSTVNLNTEMYLDLAFQKSDAKKIIQRVNEQNTKLDEFLPNDYIFYKSLEELLSQECVIVYGND